MKIMVFWGFLTLLFSGLISAKDPCSTTCRCESSLIDCSHLNLSNDANLFRTWTKNGSTTSEVDLSYNFLKTIPVLTGLNISKLSYKHNLLDHIGPRAFDGMNTLLVLDLSHNGITTLDNDAFESKTPLPILQLDLSHNRLHNFHRGDVFKENLNRLQTLNLSNNPIAILSIETLRSLESLKSLRTLSLANTRLGTIGEMYQYQYPRLAELDLSSNLFSVLPSRYPNEEKLCKLDISRNSRITEIHNDTFSGNLRNLRILFLSGMNKLSHIGPGSFGRLQSLQTLVLTRNYALRQISPDIFYPMSGANFSLINLHLNDNRLKYLPRNLLPSEYNWQNLKVLDLQRNQWVCDCHSAWILSKLLPQIEKKTPHLINDLTCKLGMHRIPMKLVVQNLKNLPCDPRDNFNPYKDGFGLYHEDKNERGYKALVLIILTMTCLIVAIISIGIIIQKRDKVKKFMYRTVVNSNVRYQRTRDSDSVIETVSQ